MIAESVSGPSEPARERGVTSQFYPFYRCYIGSMIALSKIDLWKFGRLDLALILTVLLKVRFFSFIKSFHKKINISKFHLDHWDQRLGSITSRCSGQ